MAKKMFDVYWRNSSSKMKIDCVGHSLQHAVFDMQLTVAARSEPRIVRHY